MRINTQYKFNIINMEKPTSEFNNGMKPLLYSEYLANTYQTGWRRAGEDIVYYKNQYLRPKKTDHTYYHTLSFSLQFPSENDTCYISPCYPYTATMLKVLQ